MQSLITLSFLIGLKVSLNILKRKSQSHFLSKLFKPGPIIRTFQDEYFLFFITFLREIYLELISKDANFFISLIPPPSKLLLLGVESLVYNDTAKNVTKHFAISLLTL